MGIRDFVRRVDWPRFSLNIVRLNITVATSINSRYISESGQVGAASTSKGSLHPASKR